MRNIKNPNYESTLEFVVMNYRNTNQVRLASFVKISVKMSENHYEFLTSSQKAFKVLDSFK